jgi:uncharacterized protein
MQLVWQRSEGALFPTRVDPDGVVVAERKINKSFVLLPDRVLEDWPPLRPEEVTVDHLELILAHQPELILLGCGPRWRMPPAAVRAHCLKRNVGLEAMDNAAAARTYTVLAGENRRVAVGFLIAPEA